MAAPRRIVITKNALGKYEWKGYDSLGALVDSSLSQTKLLQSFATRQAAADNHRLKHPLEQCETVIPDGS